MAETPKQDDIAKSREVAEAAREEEWQGAGFIRVVLVVVLGAFTVKIGLDVVGQLS